MRTIVFWGSFCLRKFSKLSYYEITVSFESSLQPRRAYCRPSSAHSTLASVAADCLEKRFLDGKQDYARMSMLLLQVLLAA